MLLMDALPKTACETITEKSLSAFAQTSSKVGSPFRDYPEEKVKPFTVCVLGASKRQASGYFTISHRTYHTLLKQVKCDRWSVNWAEYFQHFFLKIAETDQVFSFSQLQSNQNRFHVYWDGQDWMYVHLWDAQVQNFVEAMSQWGKPYHFAMNKGISLHGSLG